MGAGFGRAITRRAGTRRGALKLIAIGRLRAGEPEAALLARYQARLRPALHVVEIPEGHPADARRLESQALLAALPPRAFAVALDSGGTAPDSLALAALLERWLGLGQPLCFLIGGAEGLDRSVLTRADFTLSLGPPTWPHLLVRGLLAEQLYRARCIATGHPYHRVGRP